MKVAIITIHGYFNYGNRLQNYALQMTLKKMGVEVSTWVASRDTNLLRRCVNKYTERVNGKRQLKPRQDIIREKNFMAFSDHYISTRFFYEKDRKIPHGADKDADIFVVGSDQVWNPLFWWGQGNSSDLHNFCLAFTDKKKLSYAASFGIPTIPKEWEGYMRPLLSRFNMLSVRENEGREILRNFRRDSQVVLDPTMLLTAEEWREVESNEIASTEKFALVYFLGEQAEAIRRRIWEDAARADLKIIDLMDPACPYYTKGPETFLELIDKAEIVYTDSFHASVFSILFHTPFVVLERTHKNKSSMSSRITTLLSQAGIQGGLSKEQFVILDDFESMDKNLIKEKKQSLQFLENALQ